MFLGIQTSFGGNRTYSEVFAITFVVNFALIWAVTGIVSILIGFLAKKYNSKTSAAAMETLYNMDSLPDVQQHMMNESDGKKPGSINGEILITENDQKHKILRYIGSVSSWASWTTFASLPAWLSGFNVIPVFPGILASLFVLSLRFLLSLLLNCPLSVIENNQGTRLYRKVFETMNRLYPKRVVGGIAGVVLLSLFMHTLTYKSCFNDHVDPTFEWKFYGGKYIYSSALTRYIHLPKACPPGPPCQLYATLPFDTATSVFLNIHTHVDVKDITINYEVEATYNTTKTFTQKVTSSYYITPSQYDSTGERNIHTILIDKLTSDTRYVFEIFYDGKSQTKTVYQTLPDKDSTSNFNLIYGGDLGYSKASITLSKTSAEKDPKAIIIGGDVSYDDGHAYCYHTFDLTMKIFQDYINDKLGRLVPLIVAVGNHDVGWNSMAQVNVAVNENGPSYYSGYAQHYPGEENYTGNAIEAKIPAVSQRKTYHAHMLGKVLNVVLDAGYVESYTGIQTDWLKNISEAYSAYPKMAIYHDPIFTPCIEKASKNTELGMKHWTPIFEKKGFMAAFEHHTHYFKRTKLIKGRIENDAGVAYLGSGSWGVDPNKCKPEKDVEGIYASFGNINHIWVINVDQYYNKVNYQAFALNGTVDTPFSMDISKYTF
jgi:hypothetical protein